MKLPAIHLRRTAGNALAVAFSAKRKIQKRTAARAYQASKIVLGVFLCVEG
jgi:hypothetical protein